METNLFSAQDSKFFKAISLLILSLLNKKNLAIFFSSHNSEVFLLNSQAWLLRKTNIFNCFQAFTSTLRTTDAAPPTTGWARYWSRWVVVSPGRLTTIHRVNTSRGAKPCRLLWNWNLLACFRWPFLALFIARAHIRMMGVNISVDLSLFVLLCNTNFMKKLKFNDFFKTKTNKK